MTKVFLSGISAGLGEALCEELLKSYEVYAISRSEPRLVHKNLHFLQCDLSRLEELPLVLADLFQGVDNVECAILNAGAVDNIKTMHDTSIKDLLSILSVNTLSNKVILDFFISQNIALTQVVAISSGASINGHKGWGSYSLSKSALNMLVQLYAQEMTDTHLCALAPGVIHTKLVQQIFQQADANEFPSVESLKNAPAFAVQTAALHILNHLSDLRKHPSGAYLDIRNLI